MAPNDQIDEESSSVVIVTPAEGSVKGDVAADTKPAETGSANNAQAADGEDGKTVKSVNSDADRSTTEDEEKIIIGMACDTKNLYQKWDMHGRFTWTEKYPDDLEEAAESEKTMKYAILVRNKKSYDSRKKLEIDSIVVQSPYLKRVLADVLRGYPGVTVGLQRLIFSAPFKPFVHRWEQLTSALASEGYDDTTRSHVKLLWDVLHAELKDTISAMNDYIKEKVVTYEHIWTIFHPDGVIYASRYGDPVAVKQVDQGNFIEHNRYGPCFQLKCHRVDWDGSKFGYDGSTHIVLPFVGTIAITDLECFPLRFHADVDAVTKSLTDRGRVFEQLAGYQYKSYKGNAIEQQQFGPAKVTVDSRIVIDAFAHSKFNPDQQQSLKSLTKVEAARTVQAEGEDYDDGDGGRYRRYSFDDDYNPYGQREEELIGDDSKPLPLTEDQLLLCTPVVRGYALRSKKWLEFFVGSVSEVAFDTRAFDSLVLPEGHKQLILAFAQSQVRHKDRFDDVVSGKGRGIIMLLSGGPGIGKTLTAEAVAEAMRVPLYVMSATDLGVSSYDVEQTLGRVLEMVAKWDAVLLLDECDVFLEARSASDLDRNKIVSIFLRTLEYYEGILFLTTNRVRNMDPAFHSRIHVSLAYPALDWPARRAVWGNFLDRSVDVDAGVGGGGGGGGSGAGHGLSDDEVDRLARLELNGRQIKNVLKTGNLLACHKGETLAFEHLKTVLTVEGHMIE